MSDVDRDATFLAALEHCRARVRAGEPLATSLSAYPREWHDELSELLAAGERVSAAAADPSSEFIARFEPALLAAVDDARARRAPARRWWPRLSGVGALRAAAVALIALLVVGGSGVAVVEASADALPGDPLYRVTEWREAVELWVARSDSARLATYQERLARRSAELERAVARSVAAPRLSVMEREFGRDVRQVVDRAVQLRDRGDPRASPRALAALDRVQARLQRLVRSTTDPQQRALLRGLIRFLDAQRQRLDGASSTPRAPIRGPRTGGV